MNFKQYKSPKTGRKLWRFDITICGQRIRRGEFETKAEAAAAVSALKLKARSMMYGYAIEEPEVLLSELFDARKKDPQYKDKEGLRPTLDRFLKQVGDLPLSRLTKSDLNGFVTKCIQKGLGPNTINRYMTTVMSCLNSADNYFPELENWTPPRIKPLKQAPSRSRVILPEEISKLLSTLRAGRQKGEHFKSMGVRRQVYDLLRLMLLTGAREGELLELPVAAVNWNWKTVKIFATKTQTERVIPLSDLAFEILQERKSTKAKFFSVSYDQLWWWFHAIGESCGVPIGQKTENGCTFYDLRHTAASLMELNGVPYSTVSAILGHKRADMTSRYTHTTDSSMREAVRLLEEWCRLIDGFILKFTQKPQTAHSAISQKRA